MRPAANASAAASAALLLHLRPSSVADLRELVTADHCQRRRRMQCSPWRAQGSPGIRQRQAPQGVGGLVCAEAQLLGRGGRRGAPHARHGDLPMPALGCRAPSRRRSVRAAPATLPAFCRAATELRRSNARRRSLRRGGRRVLLPAAVPPPAVLPLSSTRAVALTEAAPACQPGIPQVNYTQHGIQPCSD